jgi:hypothetical protein
MIGAICVVLYVFIGNVQVIAVVGVLAVVGAYVITPEP